MVLVSAVVLSAQQQPPVFRSSLQVVAIPASVRDGNRPVMNLTAVDFELLDNGVVQKVQSVSAGSLPIDLTLVLDLSGSVSGPLLERLRQGVRDTAKLLKDDDRVRLVAVSHVLRQIFDLQPGRDPMPLDRLTAEGATSLYDGLAAVMMQTSAPGRRHLVLAFTDGHDSSSIVDSAALREIARRTEAVVDVVIYAPPPEGRPDQSRLPTQIPLGSGMAMGSVPGGNVVMGNNASAMADRARALKPWEAPDVLSTIVYDLVSPTAGQTFVLGLGESVTNAFRRVLEDFRSGYVLTYEPEGVARPGWHDVTVRVTRPGKFDVLARRGYSGGSELRTP